MTDQRTRAPAALRTVRVSGRRTTIAMEPAFWSAFDRVVAARGGTADDLLTEIDKRRPLGASLTSAVRVFLVTWLVALVDTCERRAA